MPEVTDRLLVFDALVERIAETTTVDDATAERLALVGADDPLPRMSELGRLAFEVELTHAAQVTAAVAAVRPPPLDAVVIGGLPRTGTTLLFRLLDVMTGRRSLSTWEAHSPHLAHGPAAVVAQREATDRFELVREIAPKVHAMHGLDASGPEECTPLLAHALESVQWGIMAHSPTYLDWLADATLATGYHRWAQQLAVVDPGARWLLKCPFHVNDYASLARQAGAVRVVHIRRDPVATTRSFLNMVAAGRQIFEPRVPLAGLGPFWLERLRRLVVRAEADLDRLPRPPVVIDHDDLVADPVTVAGAVAGQLDEPVVHVPDRAPTRAADYDRLPLEVFGLTETAVLRVLGPHAGGPLLGRG